MVTASLGSIAVKIQARVADIPTNISGAVVDILDEQRLFMEEYIGVSIGSVGIAEKYQPALTNLGIAAILDLMQLEGADTSSFTIGAYSEQRSGDSGLSKAGDGYKELGMEQLKALGRVIRFRQVLG